MGVVEKLCLIEKCFLAGCILVDNFATHCGNNILNVFACADVDWCCSLEAERFGDKLPVFSPWSCLLVERVLASKQSRRNILIIIDADDVSRRDDRAMGRVDI